MNGLMPTEDKVDVSSQPHPFTEGEVVTWHGMRQGFPDNRDEFPLADWHQ